MAEAKTGNGFDVDDPPRVRRRILKVVLSPEQLRKQALDELDEAFAELVPWSLPPRVPVPGEPFFPYRKWRRLGLKQAIDRLPESFLARSTSNCRSA